MELEDDSLELMLGLTTSSEWPRKAPELLERLLRATTERPGLRRPSADLIRTLLEQSEVPKAVKEVAVSAAVRIFRQLRIQKVELSPL